MKATTGLRTAGAILALLAAATPVCAGPEPFLGEVQTVTFSFCPRGFEPTNGQILPINTNQALFSLLGTTYGGDGIITFALPTITPTYAANGAIERYCIATQGIFPSRN